jgi:Na+/H+ antiporter NhaD/arsenite permease-like protein
MLGPILSLLALLIAISLSIFTSVNIGLLGLGFAYGLGALILGLPTREISALFPTNLMLTLLGLTFLFGHAKANGTLDRLAGWAVQLARGRVGLLPPLFFVLALLLGTLGAGNIGAVALLAPIAMEVAADLEIPPFLMALMVACGGNAAAFSPVAPTGVIAVALMGRIGLPGYGWHNYRQCLVAHVLVGFAGYLLFGGLRLLRSRPSEAQALRLHAVLAARRQALTWRHYLTLVVLVAMLGVVARYRLDVGVVALAAALFLSLSRAGDDEGALRAIPWETVLMVCGMTVLMTLMEKTGGIDLCTRMLGQLSTVSTAPLTMGLLTGALSAYSSSSGVVLPAFLPTIPGLLQKLGGGSALALADSVNVGAHLVDVSPLSTLGALCLAHAARAEQGRLYRQLLAWGLGMVVVGGLYCYVVFGLLRSGG